MDFDGSDFVAWFALRHVLERASLLALHEGAATFGFSEFWLFAVGIAFELLEVRTLSALANALSQTAAVVGSKSDPVI